VGRYSLAIIFINPAGAARAPQPPGGNDPRAGMATERPAAPPQTPPQTPPRTPPPPPPPPAAPPGRPKLHPGSRRLFAESHFLPAERVDSVLALLENRAVAEVDAQMVHVSRALRFANIAA